MDKIEFVSTDPIAIINDRVIVTQPCFKAIVDCITKQASTINNLIDAVEKLDVKIDGVSDAAAKGIADAKDMSLQAQTTIQSLAIAVQRLGGLE